jgi:ribosomal protein L13
VEQEPKKEAVEPVVESFVAQPPNDVIMALVAGMLAVAVATPIVQNQLTRFVPNKPATYAITVVIVAALFLTAKKFVN